MMQFSPRQAAKLVRVNASTILRAIKSGKLSAGRGDDGSYSIDGSELARVYDLHLEEVMHPAAMPHAAAAHAALETAAGSGVEAAVLRVQLELLAAQLAREREDRERERDMILERERETVDDLRKRLDQEQEDRRTLQRQLAAPAPHSAPTVPPELPAMVEELRQRLEESEAHVRAMVMPPPAPQAAQEQPSEPSAGVTLARAARGLLGRLLGR